LAALMLAPALAQAPGQPSPGTTPQQQESQQQQQQQQQPSSPQKGGQPGFVQEQSENEWRGTNLVDTNVRDSNDEMIGEIEDVLIDSNGAVKAVVISVGGFIGVGEKNVAVPFSALTIKRQANDDDIDRIAVNFTRDQLQNAPAFRFYGEGTGGRGTGAPTTGSGAPQTDSPAGSGSR